MKKALRGVLLTALFFLASNCYAAPYLYFTGDGINSSNKDTVFVTTESVIELNIAVGGFSGESYDGLKFDIPIPEVNGFSFSVDSAHFNPKYQANFMAHSKIDDGDFHLQYVAFGGDQIENDDEVFLGIKLSFSEPFILELNSVMLDFSDSVFSDINGNSTSILSNSITFSAVPIPSSMLLLGCGLLALFGIRRRQ